MNFTENTSVVEALKAKGLYKETGRIPQQLLKTILPNGEVSEHIMSAIDYMDIKIFADEIDNALAWRNPFVKALYAKNAEAMVNGIRIVNMESASGFKGANAGGRQLDALLFRPEQFQDPDSGPSAIKTTWARVIGAAAPLQYIVNRSALGPGYGTKPALLMADDEGICLFGFFNPAASPCCDAVQLTYLSQTFNIQNLNYSAVNAFYGSSVVELKQPLIVAPKEDALVDVYYFKAGNDQLEPLGIWIKMSSALRALATS